jgi:prevent-host-death family protein
VELAMQKIGVLEARSKLPDLLKRVALKGDRITITNRGEPVADLVPSGKTRIAMASEAIHAIKAMRAGKVTHASFDDMRKRGRR